MGAMHAEARVVTLHYAIGATTGEALVSTFGGNPATLAVGGGELAPALERCLEQVATGTRRVFVLAAGEAFGERRESLVQSFPRTEFPEGMALEPGTVIEFSGPEGARHPGIVREIDDRAVRVDFNHPLAGCAVRFEVEVIAVT